MHPFIHPSDEHKNRPEHNHHYTRANQVHTHNTRLAASMQQFIPNTNKYWNKHKPKHAASALTVKYMQIWNSLPETIRMEKNIKLFKLVLKKHLLEQQSGQ